MKHLSLRWNFFQIKLSLVNFVVKIQLTDTLAGQIISHSTQKSIWPFEVRSDNGMENMLNWKELSG
jgi:hypothetical protein